MFKKTFIVGMILASFFLARDFVFASDSVVYVDESYDGGDSDGSSEKPFDNIEDAIKEGKSKIHVKDGTYKDKITLGSGMELTGESKSTIISGTITMKGGSSLNSLTVSGATTGVYVEKDASVVISNCDIRNNSSIGINIMEGGGKLTVKNSKVYSNNQKGFYIQRGNKVEITGCSIYNNNGEGIDIRAKVNGTIKNNSIYNNKESGIEVIVGSSDLSISNNTIKSNSASGIATQFYSENKKIGQIKITSNKITKNGKYGLSCGTPSGGKPSKGYWSKSLELKDNNIDNNKGKAIAGSCKIIEAVDEDEEKDNVIVEDPNAKEIAEKIAEEEKIKKEEEEKLKNENEAEETRKIREDEIKQETSLVVSEADLLVKNVSTKSLEIQSTGKLKKIFFGVDQEKVAEAKKELENLDGSLEKLRSLQGETTDEDTRANIASKLAELELKKNTFTKAVEESGEKIGIWGWFTGLFD